MRIAIRPPLITNKAYERSAVQDARHTTKRAEQDRFFYRVPCAVSRGPFFIYLARRRERLPASGRKATPQMMP
jgi:hypothetical protein